jgi:hypothetical protein
MAAAGRAKQQKAHAANAYKQRSQNAGDNPKKLAKASWIEWKGPLINVN